MATRNVSLSRSALSQVSPRPTPFPIANSAVRKYHRLGAGVALTYLDRAFATSNYWGESGTPQARGWAEKIRECFETYVELADRDSRPCLNSPVIADVPLNGNTLGVQIDLILLDDAGYVARLPLWEIQQLSRAEAELLAAPLVLAVEQDLGQGRTVGVEVWHLRSATEEVVAAPEALSKVDEAARIVTRYLEA